MATDEEKTERYKAMLRIVGEVRADYGEDFNPHGFADVITLWEQEGLLSPEKIIEVIKAPKSSPEQLEYMRGWRLEQKHLKALKVEEERLQGKIDKALRRKVGYCYICRDSKPIVSPKHEIREKYNQKKIIVLSKCPDCSNLMSSWGGWLR